MIGDAEFGRGLEKFILSVYIFALYDLYEWSVMRLMICRAQLVLSAV